MSHGGARPGAGRKPKARRQPATYLYVPVSAEAEAAAIQDLAPDERRARLLGGWPPAQLRASAPDGAWLELAWAGEVYARGYHPAGMSPVQQAAVGAALGRLQPDAGGTLHLEDVIAVLEQAGYRVESLVL